MGTSQNLPEFFWRYKQAIVFWALATAHHCSPLKIQLWAWLKRNTTKICRKLWFLHVSTLQNGGGSIWFSSSRRPSHILATWQKSPASPAHQAAADGSAWPGQTNRKSPNRHTSRRWAWDTPSPPELLRKLRSFEKTWIFPKPNLWLENWMSGGLNPVMQRPGLRENWGKWTVLCITSFATSLSFGQVFMNRTMHHECV